MKHLKRILALFAVVLLLLSLAACGENDESTPRTPEVVDYSGKSISVSLSQTAADYGFAKLFDSDIYSFSETDAFSENVSSDLSVMPLWRFAELTAAGQSLKILAVSSFGQTSVVTNGEEIGGVKDLDGKTIAVAQAYPVSAASLSRTFDQTAQTVQAILEKYGVKASVEIDQIENVFDRIKAGSASIAVLPEPYATLATVQSSAKVAFTLTNAWSEAGEVSSMIEYCIAAKTSFLTQNPQGVKKVLSDLRASVEWVNLNPTDAVNLLVEKNRLDGAVLQTDSEQSDKKQDAAQKQQAIDLIARSNIVLIEGASMIDCVNNGGFLSEELPENLFYISE